MPVFRLFQRGLAVDDAVPASSVVAPKYEFRWRHGAPSPQPARQLGSTTIVEVDLVDERVVGLCPVTPGVRVRVTAPSVLGQLQGLT